MYTLIRTVQWRRFLSEQTPVLGGSFVLAELLYKFHSFTLECMAFLATWFALDAVVSLARRTLNTARGAETTR